MSSFRSKEDDVAKISTSVYVTNFPESISAKELFNSCKIYGHVVDSFIPSKRAKNGKRFGFVRFINVFNAERLVNNLCTVWIDRHKLQANIARFQRTMASRSYAGGKMSGGSGNNIKETFTNEKANVKPNGFSGWRGENSYVGIVKGEVNPKCFEKTRPVVTLMRMLDYKGSYSNSLLCRVKEFTSLANLKITLSNEGFADFKIQSRCELLGPYWNCPRKKKMTMLQPSLAAILGFLTQKSGFLLEFQFEKRRQWVEVEGIPFKLWANETPGWVPEFSDDSEEDEQVDNYVNEEDGNEQNPSFFGDDSDEERIPETVFQVDDQGEKNKEEGELVQDHKIPPGFSPKEKYDENSLHEGGDNKDMEEPKDRNAISKQCKFSKKSNDGGNDSISSGHFKASEIPRTGGSILGLLDEVVKVGMVMGYKMEGCMSNIAEIIEAQGADEVVIMGDFNEVRCKSNRLGSVFNARSAQMFNSFIVDSGLVEINLGGCHYTWCHKSAKKMSKLDRFLVSENLLNTSPHITAVSLDRFLSDHRPILLRERYVDYGPTPFNFFHYWLDMEGFNKVVEDAWNSYSGKEYNAMRYLMGKFKHLKRKIQEWNVLNKAGANRDKAQYIRDLVDIDGIIDCGKRREDDVIKRAEIINKIQKIDELNSKELAQKIKIKWAIEGDENSSFFHGMLNKKRTNTSIRGVMVDGIWVDDPHKVKNEFMEHFSTRFCNPGNKGASIQMEFPKKISDTQLREIESEVTNEEIKKAVWDCGTEKAPGPDGFTFGFYRHYWYLIHNDVYAAVRYFFMNIDIPKGCNSSFIALIPKSSNANLVKDFRPISLIGSLYKIIAKILANRLVGVLDNIVSEVQSAFIADRQILDGPFILNEVLQWCKTKAKQAMIFKVDFEKAFDSVRWDFLDDVLRKFGFGDTWCKWIQCCLKSSRGSILVNGSPTEEFQFGKGLKQGGGLCTWTVNRAAMKLGCHVLKTPFTYLGSIVGGNMSRKQSWIETVDKIKKKLSKWKMNTKKATWVNWKKALASKDRGGLGISSLYAMNIGLLLKWVWRFVTQKNTLWTRVIQALHEVHGRIGVASRGGYNSCWTAIIQETNSLLTKCIDVMNHIRIKLGNKDKTMFWEDKWCAGETLKDKFNHLYALESCKHVTVGTKFSQPLLSSSFRRTPRGGIEMDQFVKMVDDVKEVILSTSEDSWVWDLENTGEFLVSSIRNLIDEKTLPLIDYKTRWNKLVPIKVNILS
ncbi:putative RNA-directed DNA polymerase, eukaryota, reverse transcriptase zinc-binding domain protein [Tanacetum coccineum]|uniref:RNA-directed DNA polymerase, eukaryota, reverse transcriptase zinc-binding domain protein n=1 Tax=Tanacetum coccineum TaxID=301880 RepID=A0ABQ5BUC9_9ASTR